MADDYKPGDVVQLRSGGFPMTVEGPETIPVSVRNGAGEVDVAVYGRHACAWMTPAGELRREVFRCSVLTPYVPQQQPNPHPTDDGELEGVQRGPTRDNTY